MKTLWGVALAAAVAAPSGCARREPPPHYAGSQKVGREISLRLPLHGGRGVVDLQDERGKVVLLDVWATWCEPCVVQLPIFEDLQAEYGARGFQVYAITVDQDVQLVDRFIQKHRLSLPVLIDENARVSERVLGVDQMPTSFLLDRKGVVRHVHEGFNEEFLARYQRQIEALLAEEP